MQKARLDLDETEEDQEEGGCGLTDPETGIKRAWGPDARPKAAQSWYAPNQMPPHYGCHDDYGNKHSQTEYCIGAWYVSSDYGSDIAD